MKECEKVVRERGEVGSKRGEEEDSMGGGEIVERGNKGKGGGRGRR
jgi:hypothetical protein